MFCRETKNTAVTFLLFVSLWNLLTNNKKRSNLFLPLVLLFDSLWCLGKVFPKPSIVADLHLHHINKYMYEYNLGSLYSKGFHMAFSKVFSVVFPSQSPLHCSLTPTSLAFPAPLLPIPPLYNSILSPFPWELMAPYLISDFCGL